jgi:flavin reductase (DIM6/NTAB) family NADH-FMN oxidoreductase RutF
MRLNSRLRNGLFGISHEQEFLCLENEEIQESLHEKLLIGNKDEWHGEVNSVLLGYKPVVMAFASPQSIPFDGAMLQLLNRAEEVVAILKMKPFKILNGEKNSVPLFQSVYGRHWFQSRFQQWFQHLHNFLLKRKKGNLFLPGNLFTQVAIAYSIPRTISIVTTGANGRYNLFPSDLNGPLPGSTYLISLRRDGKACSQVMTARKYVISQVPVSMRNAAYSMGKNHMRDTKAVSELELTGGVSEVFQMPLPVQSSGYSEIIVESFTDVGIHRIIAGTIVNQKIFNNQPVLAHVHRNYAAWREKTGKPLNLFLR